MGLVGLGHESSIVPGSGEGCVRLARFLASSVRGEVEPRDEDQASNSGRMSCLGILGHEEILYCTCVR